LLLLLDFLRAIECLLEDFHGHASANPHFPAPIYRSCVVDAAHHELAGHDRLVQMLPEDVAVVNVLNDGSRLRLEVLSFLCLELDEGSQHFVVEFFGSSLLDYFVMILGLLLTSLQMNHCEA
jgi:hypothetical protein